MAETTYNTFCGQELDERPEMALIRLLFNAPRMRLHCAHEGLGALGPDL